MTYNVAKIRFPCFSDKYGKLVPVEGGKNIPFEIKRVYYIFDVPLEKRRGFHSHRNLHQVLICVHGSVSILVKSGETYEVFEMNDPREGLYIGPMVWREMFDFSEGAVLLVLASEHYEEDDYIRNYDKYLESVQHVF